MVSGLAEFRHPEIDRHGDARDAIVANYSAVSDSAWAGALDALCSVMPGASWKA
jgi:GntR family transcriptional regulator/MocR family aminotransferase